MLFKRPAYIPFVDLGRVGPLLTGTAVASLACMSLSGGFGLTQRFFKLAAARHFDSSTGLQNWY
jgi:hypothetical protein